MTNPAKTNLFALTLCILAGLFLLAQPVWACPPQDLAPNEVRLYRQAGCKGPYIPYKLNKGATQTSHHQLNPEFAECKVRSVALGRDVKAAVFYNSNLLSKYPKFYIIDGHISDYRQWTQKQTNTNPTCGMTRMGSMIIFPRKNSNPTGVFLHGFWLTKSKVKTPWYAFYPTPEDPAKSSQSYVTRFFHAHYNKWLYLGANKFHVFGAGLKATLFPQKGGKAFVPESGVYTRKPTTLFWPPYDSTPQNLLTKITVSRLATTKAFTPSVTIVSMLLSCAGVWKSSLGVDFKVLQNGDKITWESIPKDKFPGGQALLRGRYLVGFQDNQWPHLGSVTSQDNKNKAKVIRFFKNGLILSRD